MQNWKGNKNVNEYTRINAKSLLKLEAFGCANEKHLNFKIMIREKKTSFGGSN